MTIQYVEQVVLELGGRLEGFGSVGYGGTYPRVHACMIRETRKGPGNLGLGMVGFSCGSDQHFAIGLMVWLYFPIVAMCKSLDWGVRLIFIEFPVREEGLSPDFFLDVACSINLINISLSSLAIPDLAPLVELD
jgi:hypothetical protein